MQADDFPQGKLLHIAGEIAGHKNINILSVRNRHKLDSTVWNGQISQMAKGNHVKDSQTSQTTRRQYWELFVEQSLQGQQGVQVTTSVLPLKAKLTQVMVSKVQNLATVGQKVIMVGFFIWEETKTAKGTGQGRWKRTGME